MHLRWCAILQLFPKQNLFKWMIKAIGCISVFLDKKFLNDKLFLYLLLDTSIWFAKNIISWILSKQILIGFIWKFKYKKVYEWVKKFIWEDGVPVIMSMINVG